MEHKRRSPSALPLNIKVVNRDIAETIAKKNPKYDLRYGFLHIPKNGGSSIMRFLNNIEAHIERMPVPLFHNWSMDLIKTYFPEMRLITTTRDPLERTISGFQSRLRMGYPTYNIPWTRPEEIAFKMYPNVESFIEGLLSDDENHNRGTRYALRAILAIKWDYEYLFKSPERIEADRKIFCLTSDVTNTEELLKQMIGNEIISCSLSPSDAISNYYSREHTSKQDSRSFLAPYKLSEVNKIKAKLNLEYAIYKELQKLPSNIFKEHLKCSE